MTAKRPPKKQPRRDPPLASTLLAKPIDQCTLEECLRLRAFYAAALECLEWAPATASKELDQKNPFARAIREALSRAA